MEPQNTKRWSVGHLVLESGEAFTGRFHGGKDMAGEVVFNTSHSGYEEMATDPSYYGQILVATASQQGNYGIDKQFWESSKIWIQGFVCLEVQNSDRDNSWVNLLASNGVPVLDHIDTRKLVLHLRDRGTVRGAIIQGGDIQSAQKKMQILFGTMPAPDADWTQHVCRKSIEVKKGMKTNGPRLALLDFGSKENILREMLARASEVAIFPSATAAEKIKEWNPDGILLSNGPGDPAAVHKGTETVRKLLGWKFIFGICMGHQVLAQALGGKTYKLRFGHRGSNHPIEDRLLNRVYISSQNHGYNVSPDSLPSEVQVSHVNLNDGTAAGIFSRTNRCMSVQFHPESHPGPRDAENLFDYFVRSLN
jgi:carbamoyl-phosphate synthase small subunit